MQRDKKRERSRAKYSIITILLMHASSALRKMDTQHAQDAGRVRRQLRAPKVLFSFPSSSLLVIAISFSSLYDALLEKDMKLTSSLCLLTVSLPRRRRVRERERERARERKRAREREKMTFVFVSSDSG